MERKYLLIDVNILPEVFSKVIEAKELITSGDVIGISNAAKQVGISRSTFYKYHDKVFRLAEGALGRKATINLLLCHESGILSELLQTIANHNGNVLTISQDTPINGTANVSITFDISNTNTTFDTILDAVRGKEGVKKLNLVAVE